MTEQRDVIVVGAGPAGLTAALYCGRSLLNTVVLEKTIVGGQIIEAADVDNYPGFPDGITGYELIEKMAAHTAKFGAETVAAGVEDIVLEGSLKRVITDQGDFLAPIVIVASGATHRKLGVPGEAKLAGKGVSYCGTCDGPFFRDKRLVVVGGGDAAFTEAQFLTRFATELKIVHRRQGFRARPWHIEQARKNEKIELILDTVIPEILGDDKVEGVMLQDVNTGQTRRHDCDGVFVFIGHIPNTGFLTSLLPDVAGGLVPVDVHMETSIPGLYAVGDVREGSSRQVGTAVGEGTVAALHAEERMSGI
jgi:thioredoxin reductase (NADPH)